MIRGLKHRIFIVLLAVLLATGFASKLSVGLNKALYSDTSQAGVMFYDMTEDGNFFLQGWRVPFNSYLFTDFPLYFLMGSLVGMGPITIKVTAFLVYVLAALLLGIVMYQTHGLRAFWACLAVLAALPLYPSTYLLRPSEHQGTLMFTFMLLVILILVLKKYRSAPEAPGSRYLFGAASVFLILSTAAVFSDLYILVSFYFPVVTAWVAIRIRGHRILPVRYEVAALSLIVLSIASGMGLFKVARLWGLSFADSGAHVRFPASLVERAGELLSYISNTFELDPWRFGSVALVNFTVFLAIGICAIYLLVKEKDPLRLFIAVFFSSFVVVVCIFIMVLQYISFRYFTPVVFAFAAFLAMALSRGHLHSKALRISVSLILISLGLYHAVNGLGFRNAQSQTELVSLMKSEGLTYGYAEYSHSNIITLLSENTIQVRPVDSVLLKMHFDPKGGDRIIPGRVFRSTRWYHPTKHQGSTFYLNHKTNRTFDNSVIEYFFGTPSKEYEVGDYTLLVWPENIFKRMLAIPQWSDNPDLIGSVESENGESFRISKKGETGVLVISQPFPVADLTYRAVFETSSFENPSVEKIADIYVYQIDLGTGTPEIAAQAPVLPSAVWAYHTVTFKGSSDKKYIALLKTTGDDNVRVKTVFLEVD